MSVLVEPTFWLEVMDHFKDALTGSWWYRLAAKKEKGDNSSKEPQEVTEGQGRLVHAGRE